MGYNRLSGTIVAPAYFGPGDGPGTNIISGTLHVDGSEIIEVPRIVADATENYMLTVGVNENSMVGEPNLRFDGTTLTLDGDLSASINISASIFYGSAAGLTDLPTGSGGGGSGPSGSIQVMGAGGLISGTVDLSFQNNILKIGGGLQVNRTSVSSIYTASLDDYIIGVNSAGGAIDLRLQKANTLASGQLLVIKDEGGSASTNNITINASGSDTIDGANSVVLESPYGSIQLFCNGSDKYFIY